MRDRARDRWFIAGFLLFACTSFLVDRLAALDVDFCGEQRMGGALCWYGQHLDPLFLANPQWLRVMSGISAWVFGPTYLAFAWAFWRGVDAVRVPAIAWAIAMLYSMVVHLWMEFLGDHPPPHPGVLLAIYLPYLGLPIALLWRMRSSTPFTRTITGDR
ncbi:EXPERA domain-containing protein [Nannocystaceae bacterium ST9]